MKWFIWPRQYGKSYNLATWWLDDPQNRAIVTGSEELARIRQADLEARFCGSSAYNGIFLKEFRKLLKARVMSFRSWQQYGRGISVKEVAVDDLDLILQVLFGNGGMVVAAAGAGVHEPYPDNEYRRSADAFYERSKHMFPPDDPEHVRPDCERRLWRSTWASTLTCTRDRER